MKKIYIIMIALLTLSATVPAKTYEKQQSKRTIAIQQQEQDDIRITAYDNKILVENAPINSKLEIYSVVGMKVREIIIKQSTVEITVDLAKGYYICRIAGTVRKVAIK